VGTACLDQNEVSGAPRRVGGADALAVVDVKVVEIAAADAEEIARVAVVVAAAMTAVTEPRARRSASCLSSDRSRRR
jgi:hypothetical protein